MAITAFVQAVSSPALEDTERRGSPRQACSSEAVSQPLEAPETLCWGATVRDISAGGIGLTLCYPFKPGTYLAIDLKGPEATRTLLARVVHATDQTDGTWFIGCEFVEPLDDSEVEFPA
jgi:hypothetical protein